MVEGQKVAQILNHRYLPVSFEVLEFFSACWRKGAGPAHRCAQQFLIARFYQAEANFENVVTTHRDR